MKQRLRLSLIDFLNAVPVQWGFMQESCGTGFDLLYDVPAQCARRLREGEAEIGLIPVIEYQRIPDLRVLPDIAIASKHEVKSVLFVSRTPMERVRRVAVDTSSRTSTVLLRILLSEFYNNTEAVFCEEPPDPEKMLSRAEAALVIGNPALKVDPGQAKVYDLARQWWRFTGLPFVFAFWAVRPGVDLGERLDAFYQSRDQGLGQISRISQVYARRLGLPEEEVREYLTGNLNYCLDEENLQGLETYFRLAAKWGLIDSPPQPLRIYPRPRATAAHSG